MTGSSSHELVRAVVLAALLLAGGASGAAGASAAVQPKTVAVGGTVVSISADGGILAAKIAGRSAAKICESAVAWPTNGTRLIAFGKAECKSRSSTDELIGALTIAGGRVVWADYDFGNNAYCTAMLTATIAKPKPHDLGICDGTEANQYYDFAGQGPLLVTREYTQCEADCAPDYNDTYQAYITLYQVTAKLTKIGPLKRDTHLQDVDAGRLLLSRGTTLEVVTPNQGKSALFIAATMAVRQAFLSGNDVIAVSGATLTHYDATSGRQALRRALPVGATVADFSRGIVLYTEKQSIHLLRLSDGRDRAITMVPGLVAARLDDSGLYYGFNIPGKGSARGRLAFIPSSVLMRLLGG